jgi:hypothetical protein
MLPQHGLPAGKPFEDPGVIAGATAGAVADTTRSKEPGARATSLGTGQRGAFPTAHGPRGVLSAGPGKLVGDEPG